MRSSSTAAAAPGRWTVMAAAVLVLLLTLTGCQGAAIGQAAASSGQPVSAPAKPDGAVEVDRETIAREAAWASGQLRSHFQKHRSEGPWASESVYDASAREVIRAGFAFTYMDRESNAERLGFYHQDSNRFVAVSRDGRRITTHFRPDRGEVYVRGLPRSTYR